jgi:serine/threonine-protein kinase
MPLNSGDRIGTYEIVALIGSGGMGEVYRARDSKLNRDVALKVLPTSFGQDPERLARFRREAQVLAALNHPNIAHVHGFEDAGELNVHALVMELVDGPTLAERIAHGPLPLLEALPIAKQIASAMEAAHEQGIIHRDLKPANIKVKDDGLVKVLDFGLAKAMGPDSASGGSSDVMNSPTLTARSTELGVILGTAAYMAPEQAKGRPVDRRADIWAFGVVLFEMLTGRRGYEAEDVSETLAAVLTREVDWTALPASTPVRLKALVRDCLVRDPKERLRDIGDARRELQRMIDGGLEPVATPHVAAPVVAPLWARVLPWGIAALAIVAAAAAWLGQRSGPQAPRQIVRSQTVLKEFSLFISVSPDGSRIAYAVAGGKDTTNIAVRRVDEFEGKIIAGTGNAGWPLFSPDGQWIAFSDLSGSKIHKVPAAGGTSSTLGDGTFARGATWGGDDTIVFGGGKGLMKISAAGGTPSTLTTLDASKNELAHLRPQFLPGGKSLLFTVAVKDAAAPLLFAVLDLATSKYKTIGRGGFNGQYLASGHLSYVRGGTLFAVPFDLKTLSISGGEVPVVENVSQVGPDGTADYAVSPDGFLAYFGAQSGAEGTTLAWVDRSGKTTVLPGQSTKLWGTGRLSPDGRFIANGISDSSGNRDIWIYDATRGAPTRVTFGGTNDYPIWSRDSRRILYSGTLNGKLGICEAPADGSGKPILIATTPFPVVMESMTPDEHTLIYSMAQTDGPPKMFVLALDASGKPGEAKSLHDTKSLEREGQLSPDGKWIAYTSMESGAPEIYLHGFPVAGARTRISPDGGSRPRWSADGRELVYWAGTPATRLMSVSIPAGDARLATEARELFTHVVGTTFDVTPDRNKFLIELTSNSDGTGLNLVTNWFEELKERAKPKK